MGDHTHLGRRRRSFLPWCAVLLMITWKGEGKEGVKITRSSSAMFHPYESRETELRGCARAPSYLETDC